MSEQAKEQCPRCSSTLTIAIGNQRHCNNCSLDFGIERNPISAAAAERAKQGVHGWRRPHQSEK